MTQTAQALYSFFSGFGLPAYGKNNVPDAATMPYISYEIVSPAPMRPALFHAWVWYRGNSYTEVAAKCDEIEAALRKGVSIPTASGAVYICTDNTTPFAQEQPDPNRNVRAMMLTMVLHANTH